VTVARAPDPISNINSDTYSVTVTVTPDSPEPDSVGTAAIPWSGSATATITVFSPVLTFKDSAVEQGYAVTGYDYDGNNLVNVSWMNDSILAPPTMGPAPILTYTYVPNTAEIIFQTDTLVAVTEVKNGAVDIRSVTSFIWQENGSTECPTGETSPMTNTSSAYTSFSRSSTSQSPRP
jgi:hypothetical protein